MDNETIKILEEQVSKVPKKIIDFLHSSDWGNTLNNIRGSSRLSSEMSSKLEREVVLVLAGLIHPDDFHKEALEQVGGDEVIIDSIANKIEEKIFAPIRVDLVKFFEEQEAEEKEFEKKEAEQVPNQTPVKTWEKMSDVVPDNLPTGEEIVNSQQSIVNSEENAPQAVNNQQQIVNSEETHPFEEKMKKVFTGASAGIGDLAIETPATEKNILIESDPYREPVE